MQMDQHGPRSNPYDSSASSDLSPQRTLPLPGSLAMSRPGSSQAHLPQIPPLSMPTSAPYTSSYGADSPSLMPMGHVGPMMSHGNSPNSLAVAGLQAQKRVYRQRRKDPSCDACRERKVKCDATESHSCNECLSRNVKCAFTKETNRRMSSIKQVQDLERQLQQTKQQLSHLRAALKDAPIDSDTDFASVSMEFPDFGQNSNRRHLFPSTQPPSHFQGDLLAFSKGLYKAPPPFRSTSGSQASAPDSPSLPPRPLVEHLLDQYHRHVHLNFPIIHWPTFKQECEAIFNVGTLQGVPAHWGALFFAVLACGILHTQEVQIDREARGKDLIQASRSMTEPWSDNFTLNHARTACLTSMFLFEVDVKSAALVWHGTSVRIGQELALHCESGPWSAIESEMRRRVWWAIYSWDRLLSSELSRPALIDDEDCTVELPQATEDQYIQEGGGSDARDAPNTSIYLAAIHILRFTSPLRQLLKSPVASSTSLRTFDTNFATCLAIFPPECQRSADPNPLDPRYLSALAYLHNTRILLHRHNLNTTASNEARVAALDNCALAARDTTALLHRAMRGPTTNSEAGPPWTYSFSTAATSLLCTHIWRCALILCFRGFYSEALVCVKAMETIDEQIAINIACGESLALFLKALVERVRRGEGSQTHLQTDEEMLVYVSADLQASPENGWVWQAAAGPPGGTFTAEEQPRRRGQGGAGPSGDWNQIREMLEGLIREQQHAGRPPAQPAIKSSSRISIANII